MRTSCRFVSKNNFTAEYIVLQGHCQWNHMLQTSKNSYASPKVHFKKKKKEKPQTPKTTATKNQHIKPTNEPNPTKESQWWNLQGTKIKPAKVKKLSFLDNLNTAFMLQLLIIWLHTIFSFGFLPHLVHSTDHIRWFSAYLIFHRCYFYTADYRLFTNVL